MHNKNILVDREQGEYKFNTKYIVFLCFVNKWNMAMTKLHG